MELRYGINPQQSARAFEPEAAPVRVIAGAPSYINLLDAMNAWRLVADAAAATGQVAAASFKHVSPAGVALQGDLDPVARALSAIGNGSFGPTASAYLRARDTDPKSSFGDMIAVSGPVDSELAELLTQVVSDGIIAPQFEAGTVATLASKKRGTFLVLEAATQFEPPEWERRDCHGLILEQQRDRAKITAELLDEASATDATTRDALLGLVAVRYTQSNSVALTSNGMAVGIAAGQQSRVDSVRLAVSKARTWWLRRHPSIQGLPRPAGMKRQEHLNWQVRMAEADMTQSQRAQFSKLYPDVDPGFDANDRAAWLATMTGLTLVSDGYLPFRDNIDHAAGVGVRHVVEPGGSTRSDEVALACAEHRITLTRTGLRLFHH